MILIITGKLAENQVKEAVKNFNFVDVHVANLDVAAFLTPKLVIREIREIEKRKGKKIFELYDFILVTGLTRGDFSLVEEETGIKCYKSTREAIDIPILLKNLDKINLSPKYEADRELYKLILEESEKLIEDSEKEKEKFKIKNLKIGDSFPIRVLGEIVHVPYLKREELEKKVIYYDLSGADMIDLGMVSGENFKDRVGEIVKIAKDVTDKPISIDTLNPEEIREALKHEIDLVLSISPDNIGELINEIKDYDVPIVIIPKGDKIESLKNLVELLEKNEVDKIIIDPILEPINHGFFESLVIYKKVKSLFSYPLFFGAGNVTELFDVDSHGVNALLTALAYEVGANIIFTPEASPKCKFSIKELKIASKLLFISKKRKSFPKDIGYNLILYKDKKFDEQFINYNVEEVYAKEENFKLDRGSFKIQIDRERGEIVATYFKKNKPILSIRGKKAKEICDTILKLNLVESFSHCMYLGRELSKAEIALKIGKKYNQDFPLFYNDFWNL
ncbi:dihydropteroate synthase-like protein [Methanocaldococcus infernus]